MKQIYRWADDAFQKRQSAARGSLDKVYQMGYMDGYLEGFQEARGLCSKLLDERTTEWGFNPKVSEMMAIGESEEENPCGAV